MMVLAMMAGIGMSYHNNDTRQEQLSFWLIMTPLFIVLLAVGIYWGIQRQKVLFLSYRLTIDEHGIMREQATTPTIRLIREDIQKIYKDTNGSYAVKGNSINETILIPAQVQNPAALEERLARLSPLAPPPNLPVVTRALWMLPVVTLVLMVVVYVSVNKTVVALSGTLLLGMLSYSLVATQRSKHVDGKTKRSMWLVLLVIASILAVMHAKLST